MRKQKITLKIILINFICFLLFVMFLSFAEENIQEKFKDRNLSIRQKYDDNLKSYGVFNQSAFLPNISVITDFSFKYYNINEDLNLFTPGFYNQNPLNTKGFNLNYSELNINASVDPYFDLYFVSSFNENNVEIEEAYAVTRSLSGFQLKIGKFRSSFGRINSQHEHVWDFATPPMIYELFLTDEMLNEKGIQINYLFPSNIYILSGIELLQGDNEMSFGNSSISINTRLDGTGQDILIKSPTKPNLFVGFVKTSFDVGNLSVLTGFSFATGQSRFDKIQDQNFAFSGKTKLYNFELTAKYFIDSYRYISFQTEYIQRSRKGNSYEYDNLGDLVTNQYDSNQSGFYSQIVYRFNKQWRIGLQYNKITNNSVKINGLNQSLPVNLDANYLMLDFNPTEFSRIRIQYGNKDYLFENTNKKRINEFILQFNFAIGSHGAHPF